MNNTCTLCPRYDCHGYDDEQMRRVVVARDTSIRCPLLLGRILNQSSIVEAWADSVKENVMAVKWMDRYCYQMAGRVEFLNGK